MALFIPEDFLKLNEIEKIKLYNSDDFKFIKNKFENKLYSNLSEEEKDFFYTSVLFFKMLNK